MIFHVHYSFSENSGEIRRIKNIDRDLALSLSNDVVEIAIISPLLFFKRKVNRFKLNNRIRKKYYLPTFPFSYSNPLAMRFDSVWCSLLILILYLIYKPQCIISEYSIGYKSLRFIPKSVITIIDAHGAMREEYEYSCPKINHKIALYYDFLENKGMKNCSYIVCQSDEMKRHLIRKYDLDEEKIFVYRCAADKNLFYYSPSVRQETRKILGLKDDTTLFIYSGGIHKWQKVDDSLYIFKQFLEINDNSIFLILTLQINQLKEIINNNFTDISDKIIIRSVPNNEVYRYLNAADVAFLLRDSVVLNAVASPTKLSEYMACGLPIISTSVASLWLNNFKYVFNIETNDIKELASFINNQKRSNIAEFAYKYLSIDYDRQQIARLVQDAKSKHNIS